MTRKQRIVLLIAEIKRERLDDVFLADYGGLLFCMIFDIVLDIDVAARVTRAAIANW